MKEEKDKKYNIILGLMIFFFILLVGVAVAFGLGVISISGTNESSEDSVTSEQGNIVENINNNSSKEAAISQNTKLSNLDLILDIDASKCINLDSANRRIL